jgi:hypothetical protein
MVFPFLLAHKEYLYSFITLLTTLEKSTGNDANVSASFKNLKGNSVDGFDCSPSSTPSPSPRCPRFKK